MDRSLCSLYFKQRALEQYDAIDFFKFGSFSSDERSDALFMWNSIILPHVLQQDPAVHKRLVHAWEQSKNNRKKYWEMKRKKEDQEAQLDDHIGCIRHDALQQTQLLSGSITRDVSERLQVHPVTPIGTSTSVGSSSESPPGSASVSKKRSRSASYNTEEPWRSLTHALSKIINGERNVKFPTIIPTMKPVHAQLFQHAVLSMKEYQAQEEKEKDITLLKDAQVAMSCVLNTMSANTCEHFQELQQEEVLQQARTLSIIPGFDEHRSTSFMRKYAECLEKDDVDGLRKKLIGRWGILSTDHAGVKILPDEVVMEEKVLEILILLCNFVLKPPFGSRTPSECDCLHLWTSIFHIITNKVTLHTGEKALEASKVMKQMQSSEHGDVSEAGRKVDCIFMFGDIELSNIEFKSESTSERDLAIQNRKNVRLARCLQEAHAAIGVEDPSVYMADVYGFIGVFYQVRPMGDIAVAGRTTSSVVHLPRTAGGLLAFLKGDSLAVIWNYIERLEEQAPKIMLAKELQEVEHEKAKFTRGFTHSRETTPPPRARRFESHILFTPTKKRR